MTTLRPGLPRAAVLFRAVSRRGGAGRARWGCTSCFRLIHGLESAWFIQTLRLKVKTWFPNLFPKGQLVPLQHGRTECGGSCWAVVLPTEAVLATRVVARSREEESAARDAVGRCRLNQVDPYPITYSLSNP
jgi:hypothetical protein